MFSHFARNVDWCASQPHCRGNLGVPRAEMPQISSDQVAPFLAWLESKGVSVRLGDRSVGDLRATQGEINSEKVESMLGQNLGNSPILVSKDGYILDGHHRWAALLVDDPYNLIRVIEVQLPIRVLLEVGLQFPGAHSRDIHDKKVASSGFNRTARIVSWRYILES